MKGNVIFVFALVALGAWAVMNAGLWLALLTTAPLYLTYRTYKVYLGRIDDERRHVEEIAAYKATIEALLHSRRMLGVLGLISLGLPAASGMM